MLRKIPVAAALLLVSTGALADTGIYASVDVLRMQVSSDPIAGVVVPRQRMNGAALSLGYELHRNLALEGRYLQTRTTSREALDYKVDYAFGLYAKGLWPVDPGRIHPYVLLGATRANEKISVPGLGRASNSETGFTWGVGVELWAGGRAGMKLEYTRYIDRSGVTMEAPHLGFLLRF